MPRVPTDSQIRLYFFQLAITARFTLCFYMLIKGVRWARRNNLSLILLAAIFMGTVHAFLTSTYLAGLVRNCWNHLKAIYGLWVPTVFLLDAVLYYRAWCISTSKSQLQKYISIVMIALHIGSLILDSVVTIRELNDTFGLCLSYPSWPRSVYGSVSTLNDFFQTFFFSLPLMKAIESGKNMRRDTTAYRRMITKSFICLVFSTIFNVGYTIWNGIYTDSTWPVALSELGFLFQILGACEIQFNSHRETDKASLGAIVYRAHPHPTPSATGSGHQKGQRLNSATSYTLSQSYEPRSNPSTIVEVGGRH